LALAGFAGAGKSTLALHLMSQGSNFVSNDRLLLLPDGRMLGVPKLPRINPGTALTNPDLARVIPEGQRAAFSELDPDELWTLEHKFDVPIHECFGPGRFTLSSPLCGLVILNWRRNGLALQFRDVDLRTRTDLLPAVRKDPGLFFLNDGRPLDHSEERYLERLSGTRVVEITGGVDFSAAVRFCRQEFGPSV
jgi:HprK-related kinase B